jgi:hypothetical protein
MNSSFLRFLATTNLIYLARLLQGFADLDLILRRTT